MTTRLAATSTCAGDDPVADADHTVERTKCRIEQYRRHIQSMERDGRESEGAALVLARLQRVVIRLQLYRKVLQNERPLSLVASAGRACFDRSGPRVGFRPER